MPMPNATVATTMSTFSAANASCVLRRSIGRHAGVVRRGPVARRAKRGCHIIHVAAAEAVDDARVSAVTVDHFANLTEQVEPREHAIGEVRSVEIADEHFGFVEPELLGNVEPHALGGGCGVAVDRGFGEELAEPRELPVFRAKVVPPVADAVGFIHGDGVRPGVAQ